MWHVCRRRKICEGLWYENMTKRDHLEDPDIDERIILKWVKETGWDGINWVHQAQ
jgi:hypothetical protein